MDRALISLFLVMGVVVGCTAVVPDKKGPIGMPSEDPSFRPQTVDLSGVWEYKEGEVVYLLTLDRYGNGTYDWEGGTFETTSASNGQWKGIWSQKGNDREGRFEVQLSNGLNKAQGRWWYTRIGEDHDPLQPGGTFSLSRRSEVLSPPTLE